MNQNIIADTSVWIEYFKNNSGIVNFLEKNLLGDSIYIVGIVVAELMQGVKNENERELLRANLDAVQYIEMTYDDWIKAGDISNELRKKRITLPLTDIAIAAVAIRNGMEVATLGKHFEYIPDVSICNLYKGERCK